MTAPAIAEFLGWTIFRVEESLAELSDIEETFSAKSTHPTSKTVFLYAQCSKRIRKKKGDGLMAEDKPKLSDLTFFAREVNSAISRGQGKTISFEDIHDNIEKGNIVEWLNKRIPFPGGVDLGPLIELKRASAMNHVLNEVAGGVHGRERRRFGIDSSGETPGLHLLVAFILDAIQLKYWVPES